MSDLFYARSQMAMSLAFHIVFAAVGIGMPLLMVLADALYLRTKDPVAKEIAKRWAKGTAVFFAVGAVSGTVLSFELGLLFPKFMELSGASIGLPFALEGFAFFTEAIFLGVYLYGRDRLSPRVHLLAGGVVALSGVLSALFVTFANAWMNAPVGFKLEAGALLEIDPLRAMASPFALHEVPHSILAAYFTTGLAVAGIHAFGLLKQPKSEFHRTALALALVMAIPAALLQPVVGHFAGQQVAKLQPLKLAAMEGLEQTQTRAPLRVGPLPVPGLLSLMAKNDLDAEITGFDAFPAADRPPGIVRVAFQVMVAVGGLAALWALYGLAHRLRKKTFPEGRRFLWATIALAPSGVIALEAGWIVTEVGRQPWIVYGVLRTAHAVTPMTGLVVTFSIFTVVYALLSVLVAMVLWHQVRPTTEPT